MFLVCRARLDEATGDSVVAVACVTPLSRSEHEIGREGLGSHLFVALEAKLTCALYLVYNCCVVVCFEYI